MPELLSSLCSVSLVLTYWIFSALMINNTLTRKYKISYTVLGWIIGLISVAVISEVLMSVYDIFSDEIPMNAFDPAGFVIDMFIIGSSIFGSVIMAIILYRGSLSSKFFISSVYALICLIIFDIVVNIIKLIIPPDEYFTLPYFLDQTIICIAIMLLLLDITYRIISPSLKILNEKLRGNLTEFMIGSALCTIMYVFMSSYFNTQTGSIFENSQLVPRIIFLVLCITMYLIITYGLRRTIRTIEFDDELRLAKEIQAGILPNEETFHKIDGLKIAAKMIPYREIGGDFYDVFKLDDDRTAFIITDVAGKGIPAAMFMMRTKTFLKANMRRRKEAGNALTFANHELMMNNDLCMFYTAVVGVYNSKTSSFSYSCGGHYAPVLIRDGKAVSCEISREPVIGVKEHEYKQFNISLKKGDMIFLYTDGVTDTLSPSGERFGSDRVMDLISKETEPDKVVSDLISAVNKFCGLGDYADDLTILVFKVE